MIRCNLSRLMGERKLRIADVARDTGLHRNTITLLYDEKAIRVELDVVDKLCKYFDVSVGDLFERLSAPSSGRFIAPEEQVRDV
ncbi:transcriptional regulator [Burkholderia cepacia]|uniref:helix-turn-helix domain-containing protein n=1 Tax=Burkholderia cepacia TaxID=292 RepID=UPI00075B671A|nr:helix-turn-helix transcriptional regulator [Burkholderia cepacia]KVL61895.1 transcriptional regulator [Burkholderia cepacia]